MCKLLKPGFFHLMLWIRFPGAGHYRKILMTYFNHRLLASIMAGSSFLFGCGSLDAQSDYFGNWPAGTSPKEVGKRLGENFAKRDFEYESGKRPFVIYTEACAGYGALKIAD